MLNPHCKIVDFVQKTLDPPVFETIRNAVIVLQDIGALTGDEMLTELGEKMGSLPVHPSTSKMLFFAILVNCLDPALTLACASDYRDPFILPMVPDEKKRAAAAKFELASLYGGHSDQLTVIAAYECWKRAKSKGQEAQFCSRYFVSSSTMNMLFNMRKQLQSELVKNGFIPEDTSKCSLNAQDAGILHAVLVAGAYPMVGRLLPPRRNNQRAVVETASGAKVRLHPHSSNFKLSFSKSFHHCPLILYDEITRGDGGMHIKKCSVIGPYPLLLLATEMVVAPPNDSDTDSDEDAEDSGGEDDEMEMHASSSGQQGERIMSSPENTVSVVVDRWLSFESTALNVAQIYCLRERLLAAILFKIPIDYNVITKVVSKWEDQTELKVELHKENIEVKHPRKVLPPALGASVYAIACILSYDGLSGISLHLESVDSLTSMVNAAGLDKSSPRKQFRTTARRGNPNRPSGFLKSLMSDGMHSHTTAQFNKSMMSQPDSVHYNDSKVANSHKPSVPSGKHYAPQGAPFQRSGGTASRNGSFKRRRGSGFH
ncbi:hypothetical protein ACLOJK_020504 [Asimina triloba]